MLFVVGGIVKNILREINITVERVLREKQSLQKKVCLIFENGHISALMLLFISNIIQGFILGALIGLIIEKVKK